MCTQLQVLGKRPEILLDPSLVPFDPEIEKTILYIRQARRQLAFGGSEVVPANSPTFFEVESEASFDEGTIYFSVDSFDVASTESGTETMAAPKRVTLKEAGRPNITLQSLQVRYLDLDANFKLKTGLINLLLKFHDLPAEDPIKYLRGFQVLLDSCPHHRIDDLVLISYFCQGLKSQDKILLDTSSNDSLVKYKTVEKAWQLISDLAESTQHARSRNHPSRAIVEVSPSESALTKTFREMTTILKQIHQNQQQPKNSRITTTIPVASSTKSVWCMCL
ncbi:hypothetical protein AHAS_Ahas15G0287600 [Arachis hypogaea]